MTGATIICPSCNTAIKPTKEEQKDTFEYGIINTAPLLSFAKNNPDGSGIWGDTQQGREYAKTVRKLLPESLDRVSGFYCWYKLTNDETTNKHIYVGQSHNLYRRLTEGLKHERMAFWKDAGHDIEGFKKQGADHYPRKWQQYLLGWERCLKKAGTTHVVWVATPSLAYIRLEIIEEMLIKEWHPIGNTQNSGTHIKLDALKDKSAIETINKYYDDILAKFVLGFKQIESS